MRPGRLDEDLVARTFYEGESRRIAWDEYSDREMYELAVLADRYGKVRLLRKIQKASLRRELRIPR